MAASLSPQEFVQTWRHVALTERSASQSHFNDLCRLVGHPTPVEMDPTGDSFTFEAGAAKHRGGDGWADVWKRGFFAWEYKGHRRNLDAAYDQLLQYRDSLMNPPLLVVSDMDIIRIHTNFTNTVKRVVELTLDDLLTPQGLAHLRAVFHEPERFRASQTTAQVTEEAAVRFAELANLLRRYGEDPQAVAQYLIRLLFCLFGEDIDLLPERLFSRLVRQNVRRPDVFQRRLASLFEQMSVGGFFGVSEIPHVDGHLFDDAQPLYLDSDGMAILAEACALDWGNIEPSVLGTLFERSLDPDKRSQLGAHYTSREDIELIVEPVLMAPLRRRWEVVQAEAVALAERRDKASTPSARTRHQNDLARLLQGYARELAAVRVLDPACGSGNFLYVALRQLLDLWNLVSELSFNLGLTKLPPLEGDAPHPRQLLGIEVNPYAHELAQATVWIGYLQWLREHGWGVPAEPILKPLDAIRQMDAILAYDGEGCPVEPAWPAADVIIGNPPFLGGSKLRSELGDEYTEALFALYGERIPNFSDLVCYWFEKARAQIEADAVQRAGLLATQGIRGGANRTVLERIKATGDIFWAQSDRPWILDGANVHVSMIGFDDGLENTRELDDLSVSTIYSDLTADVDLTTAHVLSENESISFMGPSPKAPFDIDADTAAKMLTSPMNPNGRPNSDIVRPVASAIDLVRRSRCMWTIYFGTMPFEEAALYEQPFEYVRAVVLPVRKNRRDDYRGQWWQYARPRPDMQFALSERSRFIATPCVSKHRIFVWLHPSVVANQGTIVFAREDDYFFGVLHARLHQLWARRQGTQLEDRPRYTPTTCFETYPFPWPPGQEPPDDARVQAIADAARELDAKRQAWLDPAGASAAELKRRTLTNLYNAYPTWLALAHRRLDVAVLAAYGWPQELAEPSPENDQELLRRLLALNLERAGE